MIVFLESSATTVVSFRYKAAIYIRRKLEAIEHSAPPVALKDEVSGHKDDAIRSLLLPLRRQ